MACKSFNSCTHLGGSAQPAARVNNCRYKSTHCKNATYQVLNIRHDVYSIDDWGVSVFIILPRIVFFMHVSHGFEITKVALIGIQYRRQEIL